MDKLYAGIGSRQTDKCTLQKMVYIGYGLAAKGYTLRSGGADGADSAFEYGCDLARGSKEIFLPWSGFNGNDTSIFEEPSKEAVEMAETLHPAWDKCSDGAKKLLGRNCHQILGNTLDKPVLFVICWTKHAKMAGGTALAMRLAEKRNIPIYNLADFEQEKVFRNKVLKGI